MAEIMLHAFRPAWQTIHILFNLKNYTTKGGSKFWKGGFELCMNIKEIGRCSE